MFDVTQKIVYQRMKIAQAHTRVRARVYTQEVIACAQLNAPI